MLNYESELEGLLMEQLQTFYKVHRPGIAYRIFKIRLCIEHYQLYKKQGLRELNRKQPEFLIAELNLPLSDGKLIYKGVEINPGMADENSLANILSDWAYQYGETFEHDKNGMLVQRKVITERHIKEIFHLAEKNTKQKKKDLSYPYYFKRNALAALHAAFDFYPEPTSRIQGFYYPDEHNDFKLTMEERYDSLTHADRAKKNNLYPLSEEKLEEFLARNPETLEEDLKIIGRQFVVENGRLDLLGVDKHGNYCIIELKVNEDTDLVWQAMHYPEAVRKRFGTDFARMIIVAKKVPSRILKHLAFIPGLEVYTFKERMERGQIKTVEFKKIASIT